MSLSQVKCKNALPKSRTYRLFDEKGLYLEVTPKDQKWWRLKYRFNGKEKRISPGVFPEVGLKEVRDLRDDARQQLRNNVDPSAVRRAKKLSNVTTSDSSFEVIAHEWHTMQSSVWSESYSEDVMQRMERNAFPIMGQTPIQDISTADILEMLKLMEKRGLRETTYRIRVISSQIFAGLGFPVHPHMLRHACGFKLANEGHDTRSLQHYLGHKNIQHTVRYTELTSKRFDKFWKD